MKLGVVIVEDSLADAEILEYEIRKAGFSPTIRRVETEAEYLAAIAERPDVVVADYTLPGFDAMRALELLQARALDVPFIVVTGSVSEEAAVACLHAGAADYLLKDRLARLGAAMSRALEGRAARAAKQAAEAELRASEERYRALVAYAPVAIFELDTSGALLSVNPAFHTVLELGDELERGLSLVKLASQADRARLGDAIRLAAEGGTIRCEFTPERAPKRAVESSLIPIADKDGAVRKLMGIAQDITSRREAEKALTSLKERLQAENVYLQEEIRLTHDFSQILGESAALRGALQRVELVAATDATVLIQGETGTGKELFARAVHDLSLRKARPLVKLNCAALPSTLIESELFGHERGAFTGALSRRAGRFELAHQGSLFLDEIGELPLDVQAKLLRVLQEGEFERVGGTETHTVDVRVIAATNRRLEDAVAEGAFRSDLYYRLNVVPIELPPLRERRGDIPLLARFFATRAAKRLGKVIDEVPPAVLDALERYEWPGNVRELANLIERAVILARAPLLRVEDVLPPSAVRVAPPPSPLPQSSSQLSPRPKTLGELEREHIAAAIHATGGKIDGPGGAAELLGLHANTLRSRMEKLGIQRARRAKQA
ncbi:MAG TPA: sigma 54-interacting transcriptional regulator [Polyangiaceae bacterium]